MSPSEGHPPVIGLLGGVASGKSTVARMLAEQGATLVSADEIAHAVLARPEVRDRIVARWGREVLAGGGQVDRAKLGERVFADPQELAALEAITHPAILAAMRQQIAGAQGSADVAAVVVDAPLLIEAELDALCDLLVFVDTPLETRLARAAGRGWDASELRRRERHQQPLEAKRGRARFIIENDSTLETTLEQVQQLWQETLGL